MNTWCLPESVRTQGASSALTAIPGAGIARAYRQATGHIGCPRRGAAGLDLGISKAEALRRKLIDPRRRGPHTTIDAQVPVALVLGHDKNNTGLFLGQQISRSQHTQEEYNRLPSMHLIISVHTSMRTTGSYSRGLTSPTQSHQVAKFHCTTPRYCYLMYFKNDLTFVTVGSLYVSSKNSLPAP
jgi:hypothetical protein